MENTNHLIKRNDIYTINSSMIEHLRKEIFINNHIIINKIYSLDK